MNRLHATILALPLVLVGCQLPGGTVVVPPVSIPPQVQQACSFLVAAVPIIEEFRNNLTAPQQALLTSAEQAVSDCASGNATTSVIDLALGLEHYLTGRGITRAMVMRRAVR